MYVISTEIFVIGHREKDSQSCESDGTYVYAALLVEIRAEKGTS